MNKKCINLDHEYPSKFKRLDKMNKASIIEQQGTNDPEMVSLIAAELQTCQKPILGKFAVSNP